MESIFELLGAILSALALLFVVGLGAERVTEVLKGILRLLGEKIRLLSPLVPKGRGSWLLALLPALAAVYQFDLSLLGDMSIFNAVDPELVKALTAVLVWLMSNNLHGKIGAHEARRPAA